MILEDYTALVIDNGYDSVLNPRRVVKATEVGLLTG